MRGQGERWLDRATVAEYAIYANRPDASICPCQGPVKPA